MIALQERPFGAVSVRVTTPEKWFSPFIVIVEATEAVTSAGAGEATAIVKSWNVKVIVVVWTSGVLVPVIVNV